MRVNLGVKIGFGFFFLILIILSVGTMALLQMNGVEKNVTRLTNEYIEEVAIASEAERNAQQTMYAMRGYSLVGDPKYLPELSALGLSDTAAKLKNFISGFTLQS